jgi:cytochrome c oxidase cbb3-type subunit 1
MWVAGIMQGLMWRATNADGTLTYSFVESVQAMHPYFIVRFLGGSFFLFGALVMAWNIWRTIAGAKPAVGTIPATAAAH